MSGELTVRLAPKVGEFDADEWNALGGNRNPFVCHEFLTALEDSGSVGEGTGAGVGGGAARPGQNPQIKCICASTFSSKPSSSKETSRKSQPCEKPKDPQPRSSSMPSSETKSHSIAPDRNTDRNTRLSTPQTLVHLFDMATGNPMLLSSHCSRCPITHLICPRSRKVRMATKREIEGKVRNE